MAAPDWRSWGFFLGGCGGVALLEEEVVPLAAACCCWAACWAARASACDFLPMLARALRTVASSAYSSTNSWRRWGTTLEVSYTWMRCLMRGRQAGWSPFALRELRRGRWA